VVPNRGRRPNVGAKLTQVGQIMVDAMPSAKATRTLVDRLCSQRRARRLDDYSRRRSNLKSPRRRLGSIPATMPIRREPGNAAFIAHPEINVLASHMGTATQGCRGHQGKDLVGVVVRRQSAQPAVVRGP